MNRLIACLALSAASVCSMTTATSAGPTPTSTPAHEWAEQEAGMLSGYTQLTSRSMFLKAGEAYFNPDSSWVIFQAVVVPEEGEDADAFYTMYVAKFTKDAKGDITGIEEPIAVSAPGSYNTCGFFHPTDLGRIIFGSTCVVPSSEDTAGYQRGTSRYRWSFPRETEVVTRYVKEIVMEHDAAKAAKLTEADQTATPLFERPGGYDAECAFSPDGRHIVFSSVDPETGDADLFIHDMVNACR